MYLNEISKSTALKMKDTGEHRKFDKSNANVHNYIEQHLLRDVAMSKQL